LFLGVVGQPFSELLTISGISEVQADFEKSSIDFKFNAFIGFGA
jgi:hypothetical protein